MPPLFGSESDVMRAGAPDAMNGMPVSGAPAGPPPAAPQGPPPGSPAPPGGGTFAPGPTEMAMANQVYQLQQMVMQLQGEIANMHRRRVAMQFDFIRDNDGRLAGMTATEGVK